MPNYCNHCRHNRAPGGACEFCGAEQPPPPPIPVSIAHARQDAQLLRRGACIKIAAANTIERLCDRVEALEARDAWDVDADFDAYYEWYKSEYGSGATDAAHAASGATAWRAALAWARGDKGGAS